MSSDVWRSFSWKSVVCTVSTAWKGRCAGLAQLLSVVSVNLRYFSGTAELHHYPGIITPAAIANYVARATGFGIKALTQASSSSGTLAAIITLSRYLPSSESLLMALIHRSSKFIEILFPTHIDSPYRPRQILKILNPYGAMLFPEYHRRDILYCVPCVGSGWPLRS